MAVCKKIEDINDMMTQINVNAHYIFQIGKKIQQLTKKENMYS